ncbi:hypothetical protein HDU85_000381 [Gaertneriomyces sp. JEL0708]|nr:hypothetical protein HDU85_000381 [Gaertneriomyces sp. JEL0708]
MATPSASSASASTTATASPVVTSITSCPSTTTTTTTTTRAASANPAPNPSLLTVPSSATTATSATSTAATSATRYGLLDFPPGVSPSPLPTIDQTPNRFLQNCAKLDLEPNPFEVSFLAQQAGSPIPEPPSGTGFASSPNPVLPPLVPSPRYHTGIQDGHHKFPFAQPAGFVPPPGSLLTPISAALASLSDQGPSAGTAAASRPNVNPGADRGAPSTVPATGSQAMVADMASTTSEKSFAVPAAAGFQHPQQHHHHHQHHQPQPQSQPAPYAYPNTVPAGSAVPIQAASPTQSMAHDSNYPLAAYPSREYMPHPASGAPTSATIYSGHAQQSPYRHPGYLPNNDPLAPHAAAAPVPAAPHPDYRRPSTQNGSQVSAAVTVGTPVQSAATTVNVTPTSDDSPLPPHSSVSVAGSRKRARETQSPTDTPIAAAAADTCAPTPAKSSKRRGSAVSATSSRNAGKSGGSIHEDQDEKRRTFLERNRQAALKCRQKKKQWMADLQKKVDFLSTDNETLQHQATQLREEILNLKTLLLAHRDCRLLHEHINGDLVGLTWWQNEIGPVAKANGLNLAAVESTMPMNLQSYPAHPPQPRLY